MRDMISEFALLSGHIENCFGGTFSMGKTKKLLPHHRRFVWSDLNSQCAASSLPQLVLIFSCQVPNNESNVTEDEDVQRAAPVFFKTMEQLYLNGCIYLGETRAGFSVKQKFPWQIFYHI